VGSQKKKEILFIDARKLGHLINRRTLELTEEDIQQIADTYHRWRSVIPEGRPKVPNEASGELGVGYTDIPGFCASAPITKVKELDYVLTPGRYVGLPDEEDEFDFTERFSSLQKELEAQLQEEDALNKLILENLKKIKLPE
jgi:type I restriction enzyme M protein